MAKTRGLFDNLYVGGYNISGDVGAIDEVSSPTGVQDITGIDKGAHERIALLRDGKMSFTSFFNPSSNQEHAALSGLPTADVVCSYIRGTTLGNPAACLVAKQINYNFKRGADGSLTLSTDMQANGFGLEWGVQLTGGVRFDSAATNGTSVDTLASASFGAQAYLQVISFTGTDVTVKIQDSADNTTFADVTGLTFTAVTAAHKTQRLATSNTATIRQYVRVVSTTSGGFTSASFSVILVKNTAAGQVF